MGLLDSNIVKLGTKEITITGTATTNAYVGGGSGLFDCKNFSLAIVRFSGLSSGTQICIQGGIDTGFLRGRCWRNTNNYPEYRQQVEFVTANGEFYFDIKQFAKAGFYVNNGSGESVTAIIVLVTEGITDVLGAETMKSLFSEERSVAPLSYSAVSVSGTLKAFSGLSYPFAVFRIKKSSATDMSLSFKYDDGGGVYYEIPIFGERGQILFFIHENGTYYLPISGKERVSLVSSSTVSGLTVDIEFQQVNTRPPVFDLKPVQTIASGVATLAADATEKRVVLNTTENKLLLPFFKFFCVNAVYKNSSNANVYKTTFKVSKFDFMDNGYNMWVEELVSVSNRYAVQTDWEKVVANAMTIIFNFNAASEGDLLYYEVKGIR